jgi:hypothetical protein
MRRNSLYTPRVASSSILLQQVGQLQQVLVAEPAPAGSHSHKRIGSHHGRPARRNRAQTPGGVVEVDTILAPIVAISDQLELLPAQWMVRMDNLKGRLSMVAMRCS